MLTFTVPEKLRSFIRGNQRIGYSALFKSSSEAIKKLAADKKHIGGAISTEDGKGHPSRLDFYLPVLALSLIFRAKFRDEMQSAGLADEIPGEVWQTDWNVKCQAIDDS